MTWSFQRRGVRQFSCRSNRVVNSRRPLAAKPPSSPSADQQRGLPW
jgi:hypothetical protein